MFGKFFPILPWKKKKLLPIRKKSSGSYTQNITISFQFLYKTLCLLYKILENLYKNRKKKQTNYHTYAEVFSSPPAQVFPFQQQRQPETSIHLFLQEANPPEYCSCSPTNYTVLQGSSAPASAALPSYPNDENPFHTDNS